MYIQEADKLSQQTLYTNRSQPRGIPVPQKGNFEVLQELNHSSTQSSRFSWSNCNHRL